MISRRRFLASSTGASVALVSILYPGLVASDGKDFEPVKPSKSKKKSSAKKDAAEKARKARCRKNLRELAKCRREKEAARLKKLRLMDQLKSAKINAVSADQDMTFARNNLKDAKKAVKSAEKDIRTGVLDGKAGKKALKDAQTKLEKAQRRFDTALDKTVNADEKVTQLRDEIQKLRDIERQKLKRIRSLERSVKADDCQ